MWRVASQPAVAPKSDCSDRPRRGAAVDTLGIDSRADFVSLLRDCGSQEGYRHIATDVQQRLKNL